MQTISRGLVKYEGPRDTGYGAYGDAWQQQVDMATSVLAAAALTGGMPRVNTMNERQMARFLSNAAAKRRRMANTKLAVIMFAEALALAAGCYIGLLS